ncbi:PaaI family thioesterase [Campylobacter sp. RM15925]|uniref:PaaI family thioesterase n=1 Tax=Campylobacter sp. RM15925 TaxID=1705724 RepID=UPI0014756B55|nr:PaaI family thioesterase [Campylobacter sp. RM15925]
MSENIFDDSVQESVILPEDENPFRNELKTSPNIKLNLSGTVTALEPNHAKTNFFASSEMVADSEGLIHGGFVFSAASYAALASVNETHSVMIGAKIHFYAPTRLNEMIEFDAHAHFGESKKREVRVVGRTKDIKVFEGTFQIVVLEDHIFKIYKDNLQKQSAIRRAEEMKNQPNG